MITDLITQTSNLDTPPPDSCPFCQFGYVGESPKRCTECEGTGKVNEVEYIGELSCQRTEWRVNGVFVRLGPNGDDNCEGRCFYGYGCSHIRLARKALREAR